MRATIAPDIKQNRKLPSGKFETFPRAELIGQIRNAIKPEKSDATDINRLVITALSEKAEDINANELPVNTEKDKETVDIQEGTVAIFVNDNSMGEEFLGAVISEVSVQPYLCTDFGFIPDGFPLMISHLQLAKIVRPTEFSYIVNGGETFLKIDM